MQKKFRHGQKLSLLATCAILAACGGGGDGGSSGGRLQFINFKYVGGAMLADPPAKLNATSTSGLPVSFKSSTPDVCTVSGDQVTLVKVGECRVVASQAGGAGADGVQWAPADEISQLFTVLKHTELISFGLPSYVLSSGSNTVPFNPVSTSGRPVTVTTTTPDKCAIENGTLKLLGKGTCALKGSTAENDQFLAGSGQAFVAVDPLVIADGFGPSGRAVGTSNSLSTKQGGNVTTNPWISMLGGWEWCGATHTEKDAAGKDVEVPNDNLCYHSVSTDGTTLTSAAQYPKDPATLGWYTGFNRIDIFAAGLNGFDSSADTHSGSRVTTEQFLGFTLGVNDGFAASRMPITVYLDLGKRNNGCNPELAAVLYPLPGGLISYALSLDTFAVTSDCGLPGVVKADLGGVVQKVPNPNPVAGDTPAEAQARIDAYVTALGKFADSRASAKTLLTTTDVVRVRFRQESLNNTNATDGKFSSELTLKGAITIQ